MTYFIYKHRRLLMPILILSGVVITATTSIPVYAADILQNTRAAGSAAGFFTGNGGVETESFLAATIVGYIYFWFLSFMGVIFMTYIIYGGYSWMTAGGNNEKVEKGQQTIRNGIWGLVIIFSAAAIYWLINQAIGSGGSSTGFSAG